MGGEERRRHKRVDCNLPIVLHVQGHAKPVEAEVRNISISGAFVQSKEKIPKGEKVLLEFKASELDMIHARIAGEKPPPPVPEGLGESSVVRWVERNSGTAIGVEFLNVRPDTQQYLAELIERLNPSKS